MWKERIAIYLSLISRHVITRMSDSFLSIIVAFEEAETTMVLLRNMDDISNQELHPERQLSS